MAPKCYICDCYNPKNTSLFRIPDRRDEYCERGSLWLKILDGKAENIDDIRVCSDHFVKKKPAKKGDFMNIDWLPNKNLGRFAKNSKYIQEYFRKKKTELPDEYLKNITINENYRAVSKSRTTDTIITPINQIKKVKSLFDRKDPKLVPSLTSGFRNTVNILIASGPENAGHEQATGDENTVGCTSESNTGLMLPPLKKRKIEIITQKFFLSKEIQTDLTSSDIDALFFHFKNAAAERNEILLKISSLVIDIEFFRGNDKKTRFYTGLTTWSLLKNFYELVKDYLPSHPNSKLSPFQVLIITLMKLRLNLKFTDLGYRFQVDRTTISRNFHRCLYILFKLFYKSKVIRWPKKSDILLNTPSYFRSVFKEQIVIIIDCFEIFIERAGVLRAQAQSFSQYKHGTTIKYLIGITTTGAIIFISDAFGGRASDKFITLKSELLDHLKVGDVVLADKGFLIKNEVEATGASLKMPSFVRDMEQLHPTDVEESRHISSIRIHIERIISTLRQKFNITSDIAPMSAVSKHSDLFEKDLYNIIVFICCSLVNICPSVVSNDFEI